MFVFSGEIKLQIWRQVLEIVTLCFLMSLLHMIVRKIDAQEIVNLCGCKVFSFIIQNCSRFVTCILAAPCLFWYHLALQLM